MDSIDFILEALAVIPEKDVGRVDGLAISYELLEKRFQGLATLSTEDTVEMQRRAIDDGRYLTAKVANSYVAGNIEEGSDLSVENELYGKLADLGRAYLESQDGSEKTAEIKRPFGKLKVEELFPKSDSRKEGFTINRRVFKHWLDRQFGAEKIPRDFFNWAIGVVDRMQKDYEIPTDKIRTYISNGHRLRTG